jgi:hypothetical protein
MIIISIKAFMKLPEELRFLVFKKVCRGEMKFMEVTKTKMYSAEAQKVRNII